MPTPLFASLALLCAYQTPTPAPTAPPGNYAIVGATVEIGDGSKIEGATIVVQDGKIAGLGVGIAVPAGFDSIDGKAWTIYPTFIDAYCTDGTNLTTPTPKTIAISPSEPKPKMDPEYRKGICPELKASDKPAIDDSFIGKWRGQGFGLAMLVPRAGSLRGQACLAKIDKLDNVVLNPSTGQCMMVASGSGGGPYPGSTMGIVALMRQTLYDAQHYQDLRDLGEKPTEDKSLAALAPALGGKTKTFFFANSENDVVRALNFRKEFGLDLVVVSARDSLKRAKDLAESKIPVTLSLDWGSEPTAPTDPQPAKILEERKRIWTERTKVGVGLAGAGVPISLGTFGVDPAEFRKNLGKLIGLGLPRAVALKALTLVPAEELGLTSAYGALASGKPANFTVLTGDFAKEDTKTVMVVLDGVRKEVKP